MGYYSVLNLFMEVLGGETRSLGDYKGACDTLNINKGATPQHITVLLLYSAIGKEPGVIAVHSAYRGRWSSYLA